MSELSVAVIGGGRWARALSMVLAQNQTKTSGRIGRVMIYRPPRDPSAPSSVLAEATLRTPSRQSMAPKKPSGGDETLQMTAAALLSAAGEVYADQIELGELHIVPAWVGAPLITAGGVPIPPGEGNAYGVGSVFVAGRALDGSARVVVCIDDLPAEEALSGCTVLTPTPMK